MKHSDLPDGESPKVQFQDKETAENQKAVEKQVWIYGDEVICLPFQDTLQNGGGHN